jgi:hypothetical protein
MGSTSIKLQAKPMMKYERKLGQIHMRRIHNPTKLVVHPPHLMFETRRAFLQKLLVAAAAVGIDPLRNVAIAGDQYLNTRLGLTLRRPPGWDFSSIADFSALRDRQVLIDWLDDDVHPLKDSTNLPVFIFEDLENKDGQFGTSILLYDEALDTPTPPNQALAHKEVMLGGFAVSYQCFDILSEPVTIKLRGGEATWSRWTYLHKLDDGVSRQLTVRSLVVFREPRVHTFHFVESTASATCVDSIWTEFISSISYDSPRATGAATAAI